MYIIDLSIFKKKLNTVKTRYEMLTLNDFLDRLISDIWEYFKGIDSVVFSGQNVVFILQESLTPDAKHKPHFFLVRICSYTIWIRSNCIYLVLGKIWTIKTPCFRKSGNEWVNSRGVFENQSNIQYGAFLQNR